eukprot:TRINITY_DN25149_c0_g1_i1.p1 TRINITY_DN25149_c0_g1~~TRINITY_DN25149_c0_g1_i1.p1  ORF type:complete len:512 (+),score=70.73 TRINITY_DN25149_c0_g1_i1:55-1590(+)
MGCGASQTRSGIPVAEMYHPNAEMKIHEIQMERIEGGYCRPEPGPATQKLREKVSSMACAAKLAIMRADFQPETEAISLPQDSQLRFDIDGWVTESECETEQEDEALEAPVEDPEPQTPPAIPPMDQDHFGGRSRNRDRLTFKLLRLMSEIGPVGEERSRFSCRPSTPVESDASSSSSSSCGESNESHELDFQKLLGRRSSGPPSLAMMAQAASSACLKQKQKQNTSSAPESQGTPLAEAKAETEAETEEKGVVKVRRGMLKQLGDALLAGVRLQAGRPQISQGSEQPTAATRKGPPMPRGRLARKLRRKSAARGSGMDTSIQIRGPPTHMESCLELYCKTIDAALGNPTTARQWENAIDGPPIGRGPLRGTLKQLGDPMLRPALPALPRVVPPVPSRDQVQESPRGCGPDNSATNKSLSAPNVPHLPTMTPTAVHLSMTEGSPSAVSLPGTVTNVALHGHVRQSGVDADLEATLTPCGVEERGRRMTGVGINYLREFSARRHSFEAIQVP